MLKLTKELFGTFDNVAPGAGVDLPSREDIRIEGPYSVDQCVYHVELRSLGSDVGPALAAESQARVGIVIIFIHQGNNTDTSSDRVNNCTSMEYDSLDDDTNIS